MTKRSIQNMINSTNTNENVDIREQMDELKALLASYDATNPTEETVVRYQFCIE